MPRSRPASDPISFHKSTGKHYITRGGKRVYLGTVRDEALRRYHQLALGQPTIGSPESQEIPDLSAKELANRFIAAQQANWRNPEVTLPAYKYWLGRFLTDHPRLRAADLSVEMFATWKLDLRRRKYSAESINHFLSAVRAMYGFAEETGLLHRSPRLKRVRNEMCPKAGSEAKPLYTDEQVRTVLAYADSSLSVMILLALNCGFGPKDVRDLKWRHLCDERVTLPRSKTGVCQTYRLWPETTAAIDALRNERAIRQAKALKRGHRRSDDGFVFVTWFWRPWNKDAVAGQFRKLCKKAGVPCYGFYRLRHCASTAMSLVANPHVQRRFMRHSQLQQQVTYTHTPDSEVDSAVMRAREKLLGVKGGSQNDQLPADVA